MEKNDRLSLRQLLVMAFLSLLSPTIRQLTNTPVRIAGAAAWLCPIAAAVPAALYAAMLAAFLKSRAPGEGMSELFRRSVGNAAGKIIAMLFGAWDVLYGGFLLRSSAERLVSSVYEYGSDTFFIVITLAVALVAAFGNARFLGRTTEAFLPIMAVMLAFVLAAAMTDISLENITPVSVLDVGAIVTGGLPLLNLATVLADFAFLAGFVKRENGEMRKSALWAIALMLCMLLIQFAVIGTLSARLTEKLQYPFFILVRDTTVFGVVERFESIVVALWVGADFVFLSSLLVIASEIFRGIFAAKSRKPFVFAAAGAALCVAFFLGGDAFAVKKLAEGPIPAVNACMKFALLPGTLVIGKLRKKI